VVDFVAVYHEVKMVRAIVELTKLPPRTSLISFIVLVKLLNSAPVSRLFCSSPCSLLRTWSNVRPVFELPGGRMTPPMPPSCGCIGGRRPPCNPKTVGTFDGPDGERVE
jgi:hypothetical protein